MNKNIDMNMLLNGQQCIHGVPMYERCTFCEEIANKAATHEPDPVDNNGVVIPPLVIKDLQDRAEMGKAKYSTYLKTGNGRDSLMDAYQEALDLVMYLRQTIEERRILKNMF